jgi:hypothetical protein
MSNGKMSDIRAAKENIPILPDSIVSQIKNLAFCGMKAFGTRVSVGKEISLRTATD